MLALTFVSLVSLMKPKHRMGTMAPAEYPRAWHTHRVIACIAVGRLLPRSVEVHHVDGNKKNNKNSNLVICQDAAYHDLLEKRTRAFNACGHADWLKCSVCKQYGSEKEMKWGIRKTGLIGQRFGLRHKSCKLK